jgi:glycosyltransferase involved in cell wall biosynthesis
MKVKLAIVQDDVSQLDAPLYRLLAQDPSIDLTVYYRNSPCHLRIDQEMGQTLCFQTDLTNGYRIVSMGQGILDQLRTLAHIVSSKYQLVIACGYNSFFKALLPIAGKLTRTAIGLRSDNILYNSKEPTIKGRLKSLARKGLLRLYATGHPTGSLASQYCAHYGMSTKRLFLFPYLPDQQFLQSAVGTHARDDLRRAHRIPLGAIVILGVLKFVPRESPMTLLKAYLQLSRAERQCHLVLVGDGGQRPEIEAFVREHGLHDAVHLVGYVPYAELPRYYALADIFVHPALREPWGVSVHEAMLGGCCVIASDSVGSSCDLIRHGQTGFTFKAADTAALAAVLLQVVRNDELRRATALNGKAHATTWDYTFCICQIRKAISCVAAHGPRGMVCKPAAEVI